MYTKQIANICLTFIQDIFLEKETMPYPLTFILKVKIVW